MNGNSHHSDGMDRKVVKRRRTPKVVFAHGREVMQLIDDLNQSGTTVVMVIRSPAYAEYARRVIHRLDGRVVRETTAAPASG